ncbi:YihY/virulence factor BrkB family protein [Pseudonocardia ailaonensis]
MTTSLRAGHRTRLRTHPATRVAGRTLGKAWDDGIFSMSAQAAFWQALSLPPLLLALLGSLGYVGSWFGPGTVGRVEATIVAASRQVFAGDVVDTIIAPTAAEILGHGRADVVSIGFVVALWASSSAVASLVDSTTRAHGQQGIRNPVWQRLVAWTISLVALLLSLVALPGLALGPERLKAWWPAVSPLVDAGYFPGLGLLLVFCLATLYKVALPCGLPWHRLLPGAGLAAVVFVLATSGLRFYIAFVTSTGYTYGALATPIAFLLTAYLFGFAVVLGAQLNNALQEVRPAEQTRHRERLAGAARGWGQSLRSARGGP